MKYCKDQNSAHCLELAKDVLWLQFSSLNELFQQFFVLMYKSYPVSQFFRVSLNESMICILGNFRTRYDSQL